MPEEADDNLYLEDQTAGAYLTQARGALLSCGKTGTLYRGYQDPAEGEALDVGERLRAHIRAQHRQIEHARTAILFAALSAEAYINGFLYERLNEADYNAVERLSTVDKFLIGPRLAISQPLFDRGTEPLQSVSALFKLRHDLVHPKGRPVRVEKTTLVDTRFARFNPEAAATFIVRVAEAAAALSQAAGQDKADAIVVTILARRDDHLKFGQVLRDGLPEPPRKFNAFKALTNIEKSARAETDVKPGALSKALAFPPYDPLSTPTVTVPHGVDKLIHVLAALPGTATAPLPPARQRPTGGAA